MIKHLTAAMACFFGVLGIFTAIFFYVQPNEAGQALRESAAGLYDFLLYYFLISGGISFVIVTVGFCMCLAKKTALRNVITVLTLNGIALICYLFFGILN